MIDRDVVSAHLMEPVLATDVEGVVTFANERFLEIAQLSSEDVLGSDYSSISSIIEDGFEPFRETVQAVARGEAADERVELSMLHPESAPVPRRLPAEARVTAVVEDESIEGVLVVLRDVSQRKEQERALRSSQRRFDAVLNSPDSFIGVLEPDGTLVEANRAALEFVDAEPEDVEGKPFPETPWWDHSAEIQSELRDWISRAADGEYVRFDSTHVSAEGDEIFVDGVIRPVTDADGEVVSLVAEGRDVTRRRHYEQELERQNERLAEFASVVSHDLRNPLNVASGRLDLARREFESDHLDEAARALDRMERLIENLLRLAQEGETATDVEPIDLAAVARRCWAHVDTADASLVVDTDRTVLADRSRAQQLLENLVRNAIEHGGADGTVTVGDLDDGFYVEDDGPGIPEEERERVFDFGYSTSEGGTGFGLSIVEDIATAHGWGVTATGGTDGGARFEVRGVEPAG